MIKKEKGKFILYKGRKKIGVFGNKRTAEAWEGLVSEKPKKK